MRIDLTDQQAHDLAVELNALRRRVLTCQRLGISLTQSARPVESHQLSAPSIAITVS
jgi:hypothetical protein